ncbi:T9SS type A sorting domain-containing protein [Bacteroidota bacterium]
MKNVLVILIVIGINPVIAQNLWTVSYPKDNFTEDAVLDLSYLNENVAGQNGFIQLSEDGDGFVNGNGEEVRFWAIGGGDAASRDAFRPMNDTQLVEFAKFLAKKGVNMIRYHGNIASNTTNLDSVNAAEVDDIWRVVAAMKAEGIYTSISPFWAGHIGTMQGLWGLGDYVGDINPWGLMYFESKFKEAYKKWVTYLYTETNPYTGIPLKDESAVALIQIKNEDGLFWWSIQDVQPSLLKLMEEQFYTWLIAKYGTINDAYSAWSDETMDTDNPAQGRVGIHIIWHATQDLTGGMDTRVNDQVAYFADVQRGFYQEIYDHYRALGCVQLINGNNWKTASPTKLFDAERWTNAVCDVMAVNRYYSPQHIGENYGWRIEPGHQYVGQSALFAPHKLPINVKQVTGKPFMVTESAWNLPHKYQAEGPFLIAAYMSMTGFDGYYWFSPSSYGFDSNPYWDFALVQRQIPMFRWTVSTPGQIGMFPANALMYRKGYIQQGETVVHEERTLESILSRKTPIISEENSFDPNRDSWDNTGGTAETEIPPIAYLAGPVTVTYEGDPAKTVVSETLDEMLDLRNKKITSITDELVWDYKNGMCVLDAPKAQGICGFPGDVKRFELTDVTVKTNNEYITVNIIPLDDLPISESEKILIQIGTIYRPFNWTEKESSFNLNDVEVDGYLIESVGKMPWQAEFSKVSVILNNPNIQSAWLLDQNGYEEKEIYVHKDGTSSLKEVFVPYNGMYVVAGFRPSTVVGLEDDLTGQIQIYPNPTNGYLTIDAPDGNPQFDEIVIRDLSGQTLNRFEAGLNQYKLNLPTGMYIINLTLKGKIIKSEKILLNR